MATDISKSVGRRIREIRKARGWRQIDLAAHAGIGKNHVSELERGQREAGLNALKAIADGLEISLSALLKDF